MSDKQKKDVVRPSLHFAVKDGKLWIKVIDKNEEIHIFACDASEVIEYCETHLIISEHEKKQHLELDTTNQTQK